MRCHHVMYISVSLSQFAPWPVMWCHIVTCHDSGNANMSPHLKCHHNYSAASFSSQVWSLRYIHCIYFQYWPICVNFFPKNCTLSAIFGYFEMLQPRELMSISKRSPNIINPMIAKDCLFQFLLMENWKNVQDDPRTRGGKWVIMLHKMPLMLMWR